MTGFLDLPVGSLRLVQVADIVDQQFIYPKFDTISDSMFNTLTSSVIYGKHGIRLIDTTQNLTEGELFSFKAPKDRTWYLMKALVHVQSPNPSGSALWNLLDFEIDGNSLWGETLSEASAFQSIWGSNHPNTTFTPVQISSNDALPIRDHIGLGISCTTTNVLAAEADIYFFVWETYKITPPKDPATTEPSQTVNESWR